jgi:hypothetical protein
MTFVGTLISGRQRDGSVDGADLQIVIACASGPAVHHEADDP